MRFEWDEHKRLATLVKHGLDFRRAATARGPLGDGRKGSRPAGRDRVDKKIGCHPGDLDEGKA
jgi:hypothetical protein